jgi:SAM-dependent methyltransferase
MLARVRTDDAVPGTGGCGADAYALREVGYSPNAIRDAVWSSFAIEAHGAVLDIGVGGGDWTRRLIAHPDVSSVAAVDIVDDGASTIPGLDFRICDTSMEPLPFPDASFDEAYALELLEHLANPRHLVSEVARVLRPAGRFIISTPCVDSIRAKVWYALRGHFPAFRDHDYRLAGHITPISRFDLHRMAGEAGFSEVDARYPLPGIIPGVGTTWQRFLPRQRGPLWSDSMIAVLTKERVSTSLP